MNPKTVFLILGIYLVYDVAEVGGYCSGVGANPGFTAAPTVKQVSLSSVVVSWKGIVDRVDCADQFLVKSWLYSNPNDYQISDLLPTSVFSEIVENLIPNQQYVFQAVAREDKGMLGKDWNKSPMVRFATSRNNPTVSPRRLSQLNPNLPPSVKRDQDQKESDEEVYDTYQSLGPAPETSGDDYPFSLFAIVFMSSGIIILILIVIGGIYNILKLTRRKSRRDDNEYYSDDDSVELNITSENMVSWRQSRRDLIEATQILAATKTKEQSAASSVIDLTTNSKKNTSINSSKAELRRSDSRSRVVRSDSKSRVVRSDSRSRVVRSADRRNCATQTSQCNCTMSPVLNQRRQFREEMNDSGILSEERRMSNQPRSDSTTGDDVSTVYSPGSDFGTISDQSNV